MKNKIYIILSTLFYNYTYLRKDGCSAKNLMISLLPIFTQLISWPGALSAGTAPLLASSGWLPNALERVSTDSVGRARTCCRAALAVGLGWLWLAYSFIIHPLPFSRMRTLPGNVHSQILTTAVPVALPGRIRSAVGWWLTALLLATVSSPGGAQCFQNTLDPTTYAE